MIGKLRWKIVCAVHIVKVSSKAFFILGAVGKHTNNTTKLRLKEIVGAVMLSSVFGAAD